jgi:flagellar biosynthesis protein FlhG
MIEGAQLSVPRGHELVKNAIAVASGKGGVGKTWLSVTLAHALANSGRRVLLFDGDLGLANVDIQLGLTPAVDLGSVLESDLPLERAIVRYVQGGFDVIAGRSGSGSLATIPGPRLLKLSDGLAQVAARYDHVVLDLGAGVERNVRHLAARCGTCLVVTTDEPTALTDAYAFIKLAMQPGNAAAPRGEIRVAVNSAASPAEGERTYGTLLKACQSFLKFSPPLAGIIRRDNHVKDSIRAQTPILTRYPTSTAAKDVIALAGRLVAGP